MVRLTAELLEGCRQYINPLKDRELELRGYKIPAIENLGTTMDQFDTMDFSDNDIRKLDGFPLFRRLKHIILNNNRICRIGEKLGENLPNVQTIVLTNNNIQELGDLEPLSSFPNLEYLSLLGNPVIHKPQYRYYLIYKLPQLRVLDFRRIRLSERKAAKDMFKGKKGKALQAEIVQHTRQLAQAAETEPAAVRGPGATSAVPASRRLGVLSQKDIEQIKMAIVKATSLEEVERLNLMLQAGQIPGLVDKSQQQQGQNGVEEEMEQDESPQHTIGNGISQHN